MKKYFSIGFVIILVLFGISLSHTVSAVVTKTITIFNDGFASGDTDNTFDESPVWAIGGAGASKHKSGGDNDTVSPDGARFAYIEGKDGWICRTIDATGYDNLYLSYFWRGDESASLDDQGLVEYKITGNCDDNNDTWVNLATHDLKDFSLWTTKSPYILPVELNNSSFLLRFRTQTDSVASDFRIDDVLITGDEFTPLDVTPPDTTIISNPTNPTTSNSATFTFSSTESGTFECQIDSEGFSVCTTPQIYIELTEGEHTFNVRAKDDALNIDPTPASFVWTTDYSIDEGGNDEEKDTINPIITILGDNPANITIGDIYEDAGATAIDEKDGDITENIEINNYVDKDKVGTYFVTYDVMDLAGNEANQVSRTVNVVEEKSHKSTGSYFPNYGKINTDNKIGKVLGVEKFIFTKFLKMWTYGDEVTELQKFLTNSGYDCGPIDGKFGPLTKAGVIKFQIANGLTGDGVVGNLTRDMLNK